MMFHMIIGNIVEIMFFVKTLEHFHINPTEIQGEKIYVKSRYLWKNPWEGQDMDEPGLDHLIKDKTKKDDSSGEE